ncbi:MAG: 4a-hydroxytetrahydrobiopterin dehydratase [Capsulimonas sp.]|uniref:4a-hydroxytetrahydrobiopterin dehydratase n=1 Tax=Capsulimonas sp. TaxID=2494211 RepID=UPI00326432D4
MKFPLLPETEVLDHLKRVPLWSRKDGVLTRTFEFKDFTQALQFVNQAGETAESINHHPDIDIRYNKVTFRITTHDSGGLTIHDFELAAASDDFADTILG